MISDNKLKLIIELYKSAKIDLVELRQLLDLEGFTQTTNVVVDPGYDFDFAKKYWKDTPTWVVNRNGTQCNIS